MLIPIDDFSSPALDVYARMTEGQLLNRADPSQGLFIAESPRVIQTALEAGYRPVSCLVERRQAQHQARDVIEMCGDIPVYTAELPVLNQLTGFGVTRGMLCAMRRPPLPSAASVCEGAHRLVILEDVMNPTNVGAIFRSAAALGMDGILLTTASSNPLYRRAIRVSMGTVFQIPWTFMKPPADWPETAIARLHEKGFRVAAMALTDASVPIDDPRFLMEDKLAIVMGTEGDGLSAATIASCDDTIRIPMYHGVDSLNVAAASAVAFWQLSYKRTKV